MLLVYNLHFAPMNEVYQYTDISNHMSDQNVQFEADNIHQKHNYHRWLLVCDTFHGIAKIVIITQGVKKRYKK